MPIFDGTVDIRRFYHGYSEVQRMYLGERLVWAPAGVVLKMAVGQFALTGFEMLPPFNLQVGSFDLTGSKMTPRFRKVLETGDIVLTGNDMTPKSSLRIEKGDFAWTGADATFRFPIEIETGEFAFTGAEARFYKNRVIAESGAFTFTGFDLIFVQIVNVEAGQITFTGFDIEFVEVVQMESGNFIFTGEDIPFDVGQEIVTAKLLISNHDFEAGDETGWTDVNTNFTVAGSSPFQSTTAFEGSFAAWVNSSGTNPILRQEISLDGYAENADIDAEIVTFTLACRSNHTTNLDNDQGGLRAQFLDGTDSPVGSAFEDQTVSDDTWELLSVGGDVPATARKLRVDLYGILDPNSGSTVNAGWDLVTSTLDVPIDSDAKAYIDEMSVAPSDTRKGEIHDLVTALKRAGVWSKLDVLGIHAAHDEQAARINAIDPTNVAVASGGPTFTADRGFTGDGDDALIDWNKAPIDLTNYSQDSAMLAVWNRTSGFSESNRESGWLTTSDGHTFTLIRSSNTSFVRINDTTNLSVGFPGELGLFGVIRDTATSRRMKFNKTTPASDTAASTGVPNDDSLSTLKGLSTGASSTSRQIALIVVGGALTDTEWDDMYDAFEAYLTAVGAV